jgi:hypothetical protein
MSLGRTRMNRELALSIIIDFYIRPQIHQYNFEITQNVPDKHKLETNVRIMNELREYLEKNLK